MTKKKLVDQECWDLAGYFLQGEDAPFTEDQHQDLAADIQTAVEDWFDARRQLEGQA